MWTLFIEARPKLAFPETADPFGSVSIEMEKPTGLAWRRPRKQCCGLIALFPQAETSSEFKELVSEMMSTLFLNIGRRMDKMVYPRHACKQGHSGSLEENPEPTS